MSVTLTAICVAALCLLIAMWIKRTRHQDEVEQHSITPEALHTLLASNHEVLVFDVRQPLDLLADPEIIVGARRIPPKDLLENPTLIPKEKDSVVYCTCPNDKTSRVISRRALAMHFLRIKFLKGGLAGWKAKGYPVERYEKPFQLDIRTYLRPYRDFRSERSDSLRSEVRAVRETTGVKSDFSATLCRK